MKYLKHFFKQNYLIGWVIFLATCLFPVHAIEPFIIKDIKVEGIQRTDPGTVFATIPFRKGDTYNDEKGAVAIRGLFQTGFFKDVQIKLDANQVIIVVSERPLISTVDFTGLREFDKDTLLRGLKEMGLSEGKPLDRALIDRAEQEIKLQYLGRSLYGTTIVSTVTPLERNKVDVKFSIEEGPPTRIQEIEIQGAEAFPASTLIGLMDLTTSGWLTWYTKNDRYSKTKLNGDLEKIKAFYTRQGYLEFAIESTQVAISPDKSSISIYIKIREGIPYRLTQINLEGEYLGRLEEFKSLVNVKLGQTYNSEDIAATQRRMVERFGDYGHAFARVEVRNDIDKVNGQVKVTLIGDSQRRVYVRRINLAGNFKTRDEVIRREMRQLEASWYDAQKITRSRELLQRLGFFKDVSIETVEVPGSPDQVDLNVSVVESATGNVSLGVGFSSSEKFTIMGSLQQDNVFGTGQFLGIQLNTGRYNRTAAITTTDPYFTEDGVSRSIDMYYRTSRPMYAALDSYQIITPGAAVRFGVPFTEYDRVYFGAGVEKTSFSGRNGLPQHYLDYIERNGSSANYAPLTVGWSRDDRDNLLAPSKGTLKRINTEIAAFGNTRFARTNLQYQHFIPITPKIAFGFNADLGLGTAVGNKDFPVFKNYYGGGLGSVRVFQQGSMGPRDTSGLTLGGTKRLTLNHELYLPVPGAGNDKSLRIYGFIDAGNVWGENESITWKSMRISSGIGLSWISPVGPLKIGWGKPIKSESTDRIQSLQFQIGTGF